MLFRLPFQYGYGDHFIDMAQEEIEKQLNIKIDSSLWRYCEDNNIILRTDKKTNCLKKDVVSMGTN
jgi:hypothetical protein